MGLIAYTPYKGIVVSTKSNSANPDLLMLRVTNPHHNNKTFNREGSV